MRLRALASFYSAALGYLIPRLCLAASASGGLYGTNDSDERVFNVWLLCTIGFVISLLMLLVNRLNGATAAAKKQVWLTVGVFNLLAGIVCMGTCTAAVGENTFFGPLPWLIPLPQVLFGAWMCASGTRPVPPAPAAKP